MMSRWPFHHRKGQPHCRSIPCKDGHPHTVSCAGQVQVAQGPTWPSNQRDPPEVPQPSDSFGPRSLANLPQAIASISQALFNRVNTHSWGHPFVETLPLKEDFMHGLFHQLLPDPASPGGFSLLNLGGAALTLGTWQFTYRYFLVSWVPAYIPRGPWESSKKG